MGRVIMEQENSENVTKGGDIKIGILWVKKSKK